MCIEAGQLAEAVEEFGCIGCHQIGQEATRTFPAQFGQFNTGEDAWMRRVQSGQAGEEMIREAGASGACRLNISASGPTVSPKANCRRPNRHGRRRRTQCRAHYMGMGDDKTYLHDLISSDRRNPTVNAHGPLFGSPEYASDDMPILDPKTNTVTFFKLPVRDPNMPEVPGFGSRCNRCSPRPIGATRKSGIPRPTTTMPCSTRRAGLARGIGARDG